MDPVLPHDGGSSGAAAPPDAGIDAQRIAEVAERYLARLEAQCRDAPALGRAGQLRRRLTTTRQWFVRKARELFQDHWDVALFDIVFGSVKAFGIYPALYFAGLTWTIPIAEYLPLNTQLWTAGYLFGRRQLLSRLGVRRYGHSLNELDAHRERLLRLEPRDAPRVHRFDAAGGEWKLRVGRSRGAEWLRRVRRLSREPNVLLQSELRAAISDREFRFQSNELRNNAYLYEAIALRKILATPGDREALLARLAPEPPLEGEGRALLQAMGESLDPAYARVIEQGNALTERLRVTLGSSFSATSLSLRWINWAYQRRIYRLLAELSVLHYRLLAELLDGSAVAEAQQTRRIRAQRAEIQTWIDRAHAFGARAWQLDAKPAAQGLAEAGIEEAQRRGLSVRLARLALRVSPSARAARRAAGSL